MSTGVPVAKLIDASFNVYEKQPRGNALALITVKASPTLKTVLPATEGIRQAQDLPREDTQVL
jgi:hypothetical protein